MADLNLGQLAAQESFAAKAMGYPTGDVLYVDSTNGNDGNDGLTKRHAVATLAQAVSKASAGDTIILEPGGSETLTATLAVNKAGLKIICPVANAASGYELTGAGTVDLCTVSAADCHLSGLKFTRTAGAGSTTAGLLTTAAADRLMVENCDFDYTALTSAWTNYGIELTDSLTDIKIAGCRFLDCHRGVLAAVATGENMARVDFSDCLFYVGQATAFGVFSAPAGTGTLQGVTFTRCAWFESDGDGTVATDTWDGTDGTDATSGPISFNASVDRWATFDCYAYSARDVLFENLSAINASAVGEHVDAYTHTRSDVSAVSSDAARIESDLVIVGSDVVLIDSGVDVCQSDLVVATSDLVVIESDTTSLESDMLIVASDVVLIDSGVDVCQSDLVVATSDLVVIESDSIVVESNTEAIHSQTTVVESDSIVVESNTEAIHSQTTVIESDSITIQSDLVLLTTSGYPVAKTVIVADVDLENNAQDAGDTLCTATGGDVLIEEIVVQKDATALTGPTNLEVSSDNVTGPTGVGAPVVVEAITSLGGNGHFVSSQDATTFHLPYLLESGKKLFAHGDDAAGSSGGSTYFAIYGRALADGATLT